MKSHVNDHIKVLREEVFEIKTKWPQFELLLDDLIMLSENENIKTVCGLERTLLYGGYSLIAPLFEENSKSFFSIDCSPETAEQRGDYCKERILNEKFIKKEMDIRRDIENLNIDIKFDLIVIPNLMHHVFNQEKIIKSSYKLLNPNGKLYIFEPTIRELHQIPNDYIRWTPFGLNKIAESNNFRLISQKETGNPFEAIKYCWYQAVEYLNDNDRKVIRDWLKKDQFPFINKLESKSYKTNQVRNFTRFPTAFSCLYEKL
tara:strand:- start:36 stop:815 length:780 start_codon:yes stop_codon:yes gene_type:complete